MWKTDGNPNDVVHIADFETGIKMVSNGELLFLRAKAVGDVEYGQELWISDGTSEGTMMLKDIYEGPGDGHIDDLFTYGNIVLFSAESIGNGKELWRSDGTADGTYMVKDINEGVYDSDPRDFIEMNGIAYFVAITNQEGSELWRTDGTEEGTQLVSDLFSGTTGSFIQGMTVYNNMLIFKAFTSFLGSELCRSDGTDEGTVLVKDIFTTATESGSPGNFIVYNDLVYFTARENLITGYTLWVTDGTEEGTQFVTDISTTGSGYYSNFTLFNDFIYFHGNSGEYGRELWKTDGTAEGTSMVIDIRPGVEHSAPERLTVADGKLYFYALVSADNRQLYVSDGTEEGTVIIAPENSSTIDPVHDMRTIYPYDNAIFINAKFDDLGSTLWRYGGIGTSDGAIDVSSATEIQVYPNPGNGAIKILCESCKDAFNVRVMTPDGKVVASFISHGEIRLDGYPNGVYLIAIKTNNGIEEVRKYILMD